MSIFSQQTNTYGSTSGNRHVIEFKAGRMNLVDSEQDGVKKKMVHPDNRKGLIYIYSADDGLTHFCWKDRTSGTVEDDLIIFPDDCEFKKVEQCKDGRVFLLKFKSSNRKLFFWLQEPSADKDDEHCRKVNELLNNPPSAGGTGTSGSRGGDGNDLQYMLNSMSQQQLMQLFGGVGNMGGLSSLLGSINRNSGGNSRTSSATPARTGAAGAAATLTTTPANNTQPATPKAPKKDNGASNDSTTGATSPSTTPNPEASRVLLSELQNYLAGINSGGSGGSRANVDLSTSLTSESINSILSDPERLETLRAHLPSIDEDGKPLEPSEVKQQLKDTLASPQFQQALSMFSNALQSGQLGPVVSQFKLSDDAVSAANTGDLEQFVKALEKASIKEQSANNDKSNEKENDENNKQ